jgi:hypothetical protein
LSAVFGNRHFADAVLGVDRLTGDDAGATIRMMTLAITISDSPVRQVMRMLHLADPASRECLTQSRPRRAKSGEQG